MVDKTWLGPVATIAVPIITLLFGTWIPAMFRAFKRSRNTSLLVGPWQCTWKVDSKFGVHPDILDRVEVKRIDGENFIGEGTNSSFGTYHITGAETPFAVNLIFRGNNAASNLSGVQKHGYACPLFTRVFMCA